MYIYGTMNTTFYFSETTQNSESSSCCTLAIDIAVRAIHLVSRRPTTSEWPTREVFSSRELVCCPVVSYKFARRVCKCVVWCPSSRMNTL